MNQCSKKKGKKNPIFHVSIEINIEEEKENIPLRGRNYRFALPNYESRGGVWDPSRRPSGRITREDYLVNRGEERTVNTWLSREAGSGGEGTNLFHRIKDTEIERPRGSILSPRRKEEQVHVPHHG